MSILITGHTGFIGSAVTRELDRQGLTWTGVSMSGQAPEPERLRCLDAMPTCDVVLHLAGKIGGSIQSWSDQAGDYIEANALMALAADRYARRCGSFVVYLTTQRGDSPYHLGKQLGEDILRDRPLMTLRLTNAYGPNARRGLLKSLDDQTRDVGCGEPVKVNSLAPRRDWLHVEDVARCLVLAARKRIAGAFDLSYGRQWSVGEVVDLVFEHVGARPVIETGIEPHETMDVSVDSQPLRKALGWRPQVTLEDGVARMFGRKEARAA